MSGPRDDFKPSATFSTTLRWRHGGFYDGDFDAYETSFALRAGTRFIGSLGYTRQNIEMRYGDFHTDLVPVKVSYAFTTLASLQALVDSIEYTLLMPRSRGA